MTVRKVFTATSITTRTRSASHSHRITAALAGLGGLAALASACGGSEESGPPAQVIQVNLTEAGCSPSTVNASTGPARFVIQNPTSSGTNSFELRSGDQIVFSVNNVLGGLSRGGTITLEAGTYIMRCAGGGTDASGQVIVTDEE